MIHSSLLSASCLLVLLMRNMCSWSTQPMKTKGWIQSLLLLIIPALQQDRDCNIFVWVMLWSYYCVILIHNMLFLVKMPCTNSWATNPANVTRSCSMCPLRLEMHTYLNIQHAWLQRWAAAGQDQLEKGNFHWKRQHFLQRLPLLLFLCFPPPPTPPLAMQVLLRLFTLTKQPFSLKMESTHQSNPIPAASKRSPSRSPITSQDLLPPSCPFLYFTQQRVLKGCCKQRSARQAPSPFTLQLV